MSNLESTQDTSTEAKLAEIIDNVLTKGIPLYELKGLTEGEMEALYSHGYGLFNAGQAEQAEKVFLLMCFYDHMNPRNWLAAGTTQFQLKNYTQAAFSFANAGLVDMENPVPPFFAAQCHVALGNKPAAIEALDAAILLSEKDPKFAEINREAKTRRQLIGAERGNQGSAK